MIIKKKKKTEETGVMYLKSGLFSDTHMNDKRITFSEPHTNCLLFMWE